MELYPNQPENMVAMNDPSLGYTSTSIMGNTNFSLMAPQTKGEAQAGFPATSYVSLEAELFFLGMSNPMAAPYTIYGGSNTGQQVIGGQITMTDPTRTSRYQIGFQSVQG